MRLLCIDASGEGGRELIEGEIYIGQEPEENKDKYYNIPQFDILEDGIEYEANFFKWRFAPCGEEEPNMEEELEYSEYLNTSL